MVQKDLTYAATINNLVLMSYLSDIYLMVFLVSGRGEENIEKKNKNKKKEKRKIHESKITTINIFGFTFYSKITFCSKT